MLRLIGASKSRGGKWSDDGYDVFGNSGTSGASCATRTPRKVDLGSGPSQKSRHCGKRHDALK
jgi:hypothetical protein